MNHVTEKQKLELVRQVRSRYNEDKSDMYQRERILYGNGGAGYDQGEGTPFGLDAPPRSSFRLRLLLAVLLFTAVVALDKGKMDFAGVTSDKIYQLISEDYEAKIEERAAALWGR